MSITATSRATTGPADLLRERLTHGSGRLGVIAATTFAWMMDLLLVNHLRNRRLIPSDLDQLVNQLDLLATIYHTLGIPLETHYEDASGRPVSIVGGGRPLAELI